MDLLVSHQRGRYGKARREILRTLKRLGDEHGAVERTDVPGIALVHTTLDAREVVHRCRELFEQGFTFEHAIKWIPVDFWCEPELDTLRLHLADIAGTQIAPDETWGMRVDRHGWQRYRTPQIVSHLARAIDRRVELDHPDKVVRVDIVGERAAVSVLRPDDVFSSAAASAVKQMAPTSKSGGESETRHLQMP
jgi:tRNA acetyltransferase TAN1